ncbi:MAG TPA: hypothetical protein VI006_25420 [Solirubrobacteraceae bacterium]
MPVTSGNVSFSDVSCVFTELVLSSAAAGLRRVLALLTYLRA